MKHWLKLGETITECTIPTRRRTFIATLPKTNIKLKKEQDLQLARRKRKTYSL